MKNKYIIFSLSQKNMNGFCGKVIVNGRLKEYTAIVDDINSARNYYPDLVLIATINEHSSPKFVSNDSGYKTMVLNETWRDK